MENRTTKQKTIKLIMAMINHYDKFYNGVLKKDLNIKVTDSSIEISPKIGKVLHHIDTLAKILSSLPIVSWYITIAENESYAIPVIHVF